MNCKQRIMLLGLLILTMNLNAQDLNPKLKNFEYLLGKFTIEVFLPDVSGNWTKAGEGNAEVSTVLDGTFIQESVQTKFGGSSLTMFNLLGIDPRTKMPRFIATDKEYGTMDVYNGRSEGSALYLSNLNSDERFKTQNGDELAFNLTFTKVDDKSHQLLIEYSKNDGTSWQPYIKQRYSKVR